MPTHADAKALAESISTTLWWNPGQVLAANPYTGGLQSLSDLETWLRARLATIYSVADSTWNTPTMYSVALLRNFVHRSCMHAIKSNSAWAGSTCTMTIASPVVITLTAHGFTAGTPVAFSTNGALPTGLAINTAYYVLATDLTANTFKIAATPGGTAINTSGSQSGSHWVRRCTHRTQIEIAAAGQLQAPLTSDVGCVFRYPISELCSTCAWAFLQCARSLDWRTRLIGGISGPFFVGYAGTHAFVEILVTDADAANPVPTQFKIFDSYFNFTPMQPGTGLLRVPMDYSSLSFRDAVFAGGTAAIDFDAFDSYVDYPLTGVVINQALSTANKNLFVEVPVSNPGMLAVPYTVNDDGLSGTLGPGGPGQTFASFAIYPLPGQEQIAASAMGATFANQAAAQAYIASKRHTQGLNWVEIAEDMRDEGYFVAGVSERVAPERKFLSVRLADWSYRTINIHTGEVLAYPIEQAFALGHFKTASHIMTWDGTIYTGLAWWLAAEDAAVIPTPASLRPFTKLGAEIWRDFETAGIHTPGTEWNPRKRDIRRWAETLEATFAVIRSAVDGVGLLTWTEYAATATPQSGAFVGSATVEAYFMTDLSGMVHVTGVVVLPANINTATLGLLVDLPAQVHADFLGAINGAANSGEGISGQVDPLNVGAGKVRFFYADGGSLISNSNRIYFSGQYRPE